MQAAFDLRQAARCIDGQLTHKTQRKGRSSKIALGADQGV
jgi:hypothetical protein